MMFSSFYNQTCLTHTAHFGQASSFNLHALPISYSCPRGNPNIHGSVCRCHWDATRRAINEDENTQTPSWKKDFLGGMDPVLQAERDEYRSRFITDDNTQMEWCWRARKIALKSVQTRDLTREMKHYLSVKSSKRIRRKPMRIKFKYRDRKDSDSEDIDEFSKQMNIQRLSSLRDRSAEEAAQTFTERAELISPSSDITKDVKLNKKIVEAQTADDVLELVYDTIEAVGKGLSPNPLSPFNIATALHRIAKSMQNVAMAEAQRLAFARRREMCVLVSVAMATLPECSTQGITNIAWAFSKIGGSMFYVTEMDRVAEVALMKVSEFSSQNVANVAGAFSAMHHSAPTLFEELSRRASCMLQCFQPQELAQMLWAFASLNEPADSLLDSLDNTYSHSYQFRYEELKENSGTSDTPVLSFSKSHLGNIVWSYAVFGCMDRPFFRHVWSMLCQLEDDLVSGRCREDVWFASQVYRAQRCLKIEWPHLKLSMRRDLEEILYRTAKTKAFNIKSSSLFQNEVTHYLDKIGVHWVKERYLDGYSLDAVVKNRKVALEIDGPSHFSRNTLTPLGHTALKRRYVQASGWKVLIITQQEWIELKGEEQQLKYIKELLKDV